MAASLLVPGPAERLVALLATKGRDHGGEILSKAYGDAVKALVDECLEIDPDPEHLPGLDKIRPFDHKKSPFVVLRRTIVPTSKAAKRYDCPYCRVENKFWEGWILLGEDGKLRLIGDDCKTSHVDAVVLEAAYSRYDAERSAAFYRQALPEVVDRAGALFRDITQYLHRTDDPAARTCWRVREKLLSDLPELAEHLLRAIRDSKPLTVIVRHRSVLKSERRQDGSEDDVMETREIERHVIRGSPWLTALMAPDTELAVAARTLAAAQQAGRSALAEHGDDDKQISRKGREAVGQMVKAVDKVRSALATIGAALAFMDAPHLESLCAWANHEGSPVSNSFIYARLPFGIERDDLERAVRVQLPVGYAPPVFSALMPLENALTRCATLLKR